MGASLVTHTSRPAHKKAAIQALFAALEPKAARSTKLRALFEKPDLPKESTFGPLVACLEYALGLVDQAPTLQVDLLVGIELSKLLEPAFTWNEVDARLLDLLVPVRQKLAGYFYRELYPALAERPADDIYGVLAAAFASRGVEPAAFLDLAVEFFPFRMVTKEGVVTSFGRAVLAAEPTQRLEWFAARGATHHLAELFLVARPALFRAHQAFFVEAATKPFKAAGFKTMPRSLDLISVLLERAPQAYAPEARALAETLQDPTQQLQAARYFASAFPEDREFPFELAARAAKHTVNVRHSDALEIHEWLLGEYGVSALEVTAFQHENNALRLKYLRKVTDTCPRERSTPLLITSLCTKWNGKQFGFVDQPAYVKELLAMLKGVDLAEHRARITKAFASNTVPRIRSMIEGAVKPKTAAKLAKRVKQVKLKPPPDSERFLFDEFAAETATELKALLPKPRKGIAIERVHVHFDPESETITTMQVHLSDGAERTMKCGLEFDSGPSLVAFEKEWGFEPDVLTFGDTMQVPAAILIHELILATKGLAPKVRFFVHGDESSSEQFARRVENAARRAFVSPACAQAFAVLCFRDPKKQRWLVGAQA